MAGMIMDAVLMLLLVAAVGYGIKLERKLAALRTGQIAFAQAVTELNAAAGRAEAALARIVRTPEPLDPVAGHERFFRAMAGKTDAAKGPDVGEAQA